MAKIYSIFTSLVPKAFQDFMKYLFQEVDARRLGLFRILFGFCMFLDVFQERGLEDADIRFGNTKHCFFPLFSFIKPISVQVACVLYSLMWIGSLGILFGYKFRFSCFLFLMPYVYFLLLDKSRWNNHSYLFALIVIIMSGSNATAFLSIDKFLEMKLNCENIHKNTCPNWNYFLLKFQFTLLYFLAAVKKVDPEWLSGYSMKNIAKHRILSPLSDIFGEEFLAYYFIHLGGFFYDLSAGFLLNYNKTRAIAFLMSFIFHGLNSQLFEIGMFPYVCLASLILFCSPDSLRFTFTTHTLKENPNFKRTKIRKERLQNHLENLTNQKLSPDKTHLTRKQYWITSFLIAYITIQITLPFTHSLTKGYNNWTKGLYGYSWDMMVYSWDTLHTKITVKDYVTGTQRYLDPNVWTTNERWSSHADMAKQYAHCIARNLAPYSVTTIQVYFDVWKSLNGRFQQRIFDPRIDILKAAWSPWEKVPWILPLLDEFSHWRKSVFDRISKEVSYWSTSSNVIFVADYPGLTLENYIPSHLDNVSLILMKGEIIVEQPGIENMTLKTIETETFDLSLAKNKVSIAVDAFHKIHTVSQLPSCYMYTYTNKTKDSQVNSKSLPDPEIKPICIRFLNFIQTKWAAFTRSSVLIVNSYLNLLFDVPMVIRKNVD